MEFNIEKYGALRDAVQHLEKADKAKDHITSQEHMLLAVLTIATFHNFLRRDCSPIPKINVNIGLGEYEAKGRTIPFIPTTEDEMVCRP